MAIHNDPIGTDGVAGRAPHLAPGEYARGHGVDASARSSRKGWAVDHHVNPGRVRPGLNGVFGKSKSGTAAGRPAHLAPGEHARGYGIDASARSSRKGWAVDHHVNPGRVRPGLNGVFGKSKSGTVAGRPAHLAPGEYARGHGVDASARSPRKGWAVDHHVNPGRVRPGLNGVFGKSKSGTVAGRPAHLAPGEYARGHGVDASARSSRKGWAVDHHANPGRVRPGLNGVFGKSKSGTAAGRPAHLAPGEYARGHGVDASARSSRKGWAVVRHANPGRVRPGLNGVFGKSKSGTVAGRPAHLAPGEYARGHGVDASARSSRKGWAVVRHANPGRVRPGLNGVFGKSKSGTVAGRPAHLAPGEYARGHGVDASARSSRKGWALDRHVNPGRVRPGLNGVFGKSKSGTAAGRPAHLAPGEYARGHGVDASARSPRKGWAVDHHVNPGRVRPGLNGPFGNSNGAEFDTATPPMPSAALSGRP